MPTSAFLSAPARITTHLHSDKSEPAFTAVAEENAPLPQSRKRDVHSFGTTFKSRELSTLGRLTSELLRTL